MKAKRLLSVFVAVAMMVTMLVSFSTVAFAEVKPVVSVSFNEMTAEEITEIVETTTYPQTAGTKAYWLTVGLSDYGSIDCTNKTSGVGTKKLNSVEVTLTFPDKLSSYLDMSEDITGNWWITDMGDLGVSAASMLGEENGEDKILKVGFEAGNAVGAYPFVVDSTSDDLVIAKIPVLVSAKDSFTVTTRTVGVLFSQWTGKTKVDNQEEYSLATSTVTVPATVTVAGEEEATPSVNTEFGTATDAGIAANRDGEAFIYDNAYAVTVKMTNAKGATKAGIQFIPAKVLEANDDSWDDAAEAVFTTGLGEGEAEYTAALINIPRKFAGETIKMFARGFMVVDGTPSYGKTVEKEIKYTITPEPGQN